MRTNNSDKVRMFDKIRILVFLNHRKTRDQPENYKTVLYRPTANTKKKIHFGIGSRFTNFMFKFFETFTCIMYNKSSYLC